MSVPFLQLLTRQLPSIQRGLSKTLSLAPVHTSSILAQQGQSKQSATTQLDNTSCRYTLDLQKPSITAWRKSYHSELEAAINQQIITEFKASYCYVSMACYFQRPDIALPGFSKFFLLNHEDEMAHASKMIQYQYKRGGRIQFTDVSRPVRQEWSSGLDAMEDALGMEIAIEKILMDVHRISTKHNDVHTCGLLESYFLNEQLESIQNFSNHVARLKIAGSGLGEVLYDKMLQEENARNKYNSKLAPEFN